MDSEDNLSEVFPVSLGYVWQVLEMISRHV